MHLTHRDSKRDQQSLIHRIVEGSAEFDALRKEERPLVRLYLKTAQYLSPPILATFLPSSVTSVMACTAGSFSYGWGARAHGGGKRGRKTPSDLPRSEQQTKHALVDRTLKFRRALPRGHEAARGDRTISFKKRIRCVLHGIQCTLHASCR